MKMKDGRKRLGYKAEHAVDVDTGAIVSAEIHEGDKGDTKTGPETLDCAQFTLCRIKNQIMTFETSRSEVVADKGYHKGSLLVDLDQNGYRAYIPEPDIGRRRWTGRRGFKQPDKANEQAATYANRRRVRGNRGKRLQRRRAEIAERSFAHMLTTGGMRRTWLRGRENVAKRYHLQAAAFNLALLMRSLIGYGKPRGVSALFDSMFSRLMWVWMYFKSKIANAIGFNSFAEEIA